MSKKAKNQLTPKQSAFVAEYLIDLNATQAAIRAGYSKKAARQIGTDNLSKPYIKDELRKKLQHACERAEISQDAVLSELKRMAFSNMADFSDWGPKGVTLKDSKKLTPEQTLCVSEVSETTTKEGGSIKFKLHSKEKALEQLGQYLKLFTNPEDDKSKEKPNVNYNFITVTSV